MSPQSCLTLCDTVDCNPPGSSVHGILRAGILEWAAFSFSRGSSQPRDGAQVSRVAGRCFTIWATREVQPLTLFRLQQAKELRFKLISSASKMNGLSSMPHYLFQVYKWVNKDCKRLKSWPNVTRPTLGKAEIQTWVFLTSSSIFFPLYSRTVTYLFKTRDKKRR